MNNSVHTCQRPLRANAERCQAANQTLPELTSTLPGSHATTLHAQAGCAQARPSPWLQLIAHGCLARIADATINILHEHCADSPYQLVVCWRSMSSPYQPEWGSGKEPRGRPFQRQIRNCARGHTSCRQHCKVAAVLFGTKGLEQSEICIRYTEALVIREVSANQCAPGKT